MAWALFSFHKEVSAVGMLNGAYWSQLESDFVYAVLKPQYFRHLKE